MKEVLQIFQGGRGLNLRDERHERPQPPQTCVFAKLGRGYINCDLNWSINLDKIGFIGGYTFVILFKIWAKKGLKNNDFHCF